METRKWYTGLVERVNFNGDDRLCGWSAERRTKVYAANDEKAEILVLKLYQKHQDAYQPRRGVENDKLEVLELSTLKEFREVQNKAIQLRYLIDLD